MPRVIITVKNESALRHSLERMFSQFPAIRAEFSADFKITVDNLFKLMRQVQEDIEFYEKNTEDVQDYTPPITIYATDILFNNSNAILSIMEKDLNAALKMYPEFGEYEPFSEPLKELFSRLELISIREYGNYEFKVDIMRNTLEFGGTAEDLSNTIIEARRQMAIQSSEGGTTRGTGRTVAGQIATKVWFNKLYATARLGRTYWYRKPMKEGGKKQRPRRKQEDVTERYKNLYHIYMQFRVEAFNEKVPIWYLLNYGNLQVALNSNKGGYGKPNFPATHFVTKMEEHIHDFIYPKAAEEQNQHIDVRTTEYEPNKRNAALGREILRTIDAAIERRYKEDPTDFVEDLLYAVTKIIPITRKFAIDSKDVSDKAIKLRLREQIVLDRIILGQVPASGQLYLGTIDGKRVRTRAIEAKKRIEEELKSRKTVPDLSDNIVKLALQEELDLAKIRIKIYNKTREEKNKRK
jgi:hypothetical protein